MKTPNHDQPRFTCRLARGCLAVFGDTTAGKPRGPGAAHVAACADCQHYFAASDELDRALTRDAARQWREAPGHLEQNILRAISQSAAPRPARRAGRGAWLAFAGTATCAVLALLVYQRQTPPPSAPTQSPPAIASLAAATDDPAMLTAAKQLIAQVPTNLFAQMQPQAQAVLEQDPLQDEVEAVKSDARSAVRFLARNFLPDDVAEPARSE